MQVWVLHIMHKDGGDVFVYETEQAAKDHLTGWAMDWWVEEKIPERLQAKGETDRNIINGTCDPVQLRAAYWSLMKDRGETFNIYQCEVQASYDTVVSIST